MQLSDFDYFLPKELIAQYPAKRRTDSRLLILRREDGSIEHRRFSDIIDYVNKDDLFILNNTKVFPARLFGKKITGGRIEALLLKAIGDGRWECQVGGKLKKAEDIVFDDGLKAKAEEDLCSGRKIIRFDEVKGLEERLERLGKVPLPPYIKRDAAMSDKRRYQTVYAKIKGAVAAPTAGLHFSDGLLSKIKKKGARIKEVTLHVGPGTFQPVKCDNISEHRMEPEYFRITDDVVNAVNRAKKKKGRIIAVGTTSAKALESAVDDSGMLNAREGYSKLFIHPPYRFKIADALLTNFHLPKSTLLMLVSAFTGRELMLMAYDEAVKLGYRFYSYGDAMLII
ncbi:MAG: tRNA preQ1(34) S-adenosylmethionine ribosyltransferase-isomerase QueA [Nitrospirota bacterium]